MEYGIAQPIRHVCIRPRDLQSNIGDVALCLAGPKEPLPEQRSTGGILNSGHVVSVESEETNRQESFSIPRRRQCGVPNYESHCESLNAARMSRRSGIPLQVPEEGEDAFPREVCRKAILPCHS